MYEDKQDRQPWETEGDLPWLEHEVLPWEQEPEEEEQLPWGAVEEELWLASTEFADWPEDMAGPEYWLYKQMTEGEDQEG